MMKRTEKWLASMRKPKTQKWLDAIKKSNSKPKSKGHKKKISDSIVRLKQYSSNNPNWKKNNSSYNLLHKRLRSKYQLGIPTKCMNCGASSLDKKISWANKNRKYDMNKINKDDWISLCYSCHKKMDLKLLKNNKSSIRYGNLR